ncbi:RNA-binding protein [Roseospirillum parvum]|uniref:YlxR domain-containing protein n=1 Tax=Roseospirillum parvum TaxID=83401 RepID=A0A1G8BYX1_9PROT|nr:RNA-binding protein [Roseospirillum parvum]SDH38279.1 hypothetical protein SAMN05421742_106156 [Roseospirillum parvum]
MSRSQDSNRATPPDPSGDLGAVRDGVVRGMAEGRDPERRCIVSRQRRPQSAMIRFVLDPSDRVVADLAATLPGRGLWLSASRDVIETATRKRLFHKAARRPVTVPDDLAAGIERALARRCQELLGLARRAGQAVAGHDKVRAWLDSEPVALLLSARDGSAAECERMARAAAGKAPQAARVALLDGAELGQPLGWPRAVHVAVRAGGLARRLTVETSRLAGFRAPPDVSGAGPTVVAGSENAGSENAGSENAGSEAAG